MSTTDQKENDTHSEAETKGRAEGMLKQMLASPREKHKALGASMYEPVGNPDA